MNNVIDIAVHFEIPETFAKELSVTYAALLYLPLDTLPEELVKEINGLILDKRRLTAPMEVAKYFNITDDLAQEVCQAYAALVYLPLKKVPRQQLNVVSDYIRNKRKRDIQKITDFFKSNYDRSKPLNMLEYTGDVNIKPYNGERVRNGLTMFKIEGTNLVGTSYD